MSKLWATTKREYIERVRTKWFLFSTVLAPLLFGLIVILPIWFATRVQPSADVANVVIIDATGAGLGKRIAAQLNGGLFGDTSLTRVVEVSPAELQAAEDAATRQVMRKEVRGYLVVDSVTLTDLTAHYAGSNATSEVDMDELRRTVQDEIAALRLERAGISPDQAALLANTKLDLEAERLTERGRSGSGSVSMVFAFGVAFLLYMSIFLYGQNVLRGVIEEKQTHVAEVVLSSISPSTLLTGKVLGVGAVGLTQLVLAVGSSFALLQLRAPILRRLGLPQVPIELPHISIGVGVLLIVYFLLGYLFYAALFAAVGSLVSSEHEAQQVQLPVAMLLVVSAVFIQPVLLAPESGTAKLLSVLPFSAPIVMPLRLSLIPLSPLEIAGSLAALLLGCYIVVWMASRIYRTALLLYGKRPTVAEIARWVRYAR